MTCNYDGIKRGSVHCRQPAIWCVVFTQMNGAVHVRDIRINYCRTHEFTTRAGLVTRGPDNTTTLYKRIRRTKLPGKNGAVRA